MMSSLPPTPTWSADEQLALLEQAIHLAMDGVFLVDEQARICYVNQAACANLGYTRDELLNMAVTDIDPCITRAQVIELVTQQLPHEVQRLETCHQRKDGTLRQVEIAASMVVHGHRKLAMTVVRDITERKRLEATLHFIAQSGSGVDYLPALAQHLFHVLGCEHVLIARLADQPGHADAQVVLADGAPQPTFRYALAGTPCEAVFNRQLCCHVKGVQALFPNDHFLVEHGLDSYAGVPLLDSDGEPIGLIAVLGTQAMAEPERVQQTLQLVAPRAAAELERDRHLAQLKASEARYRGLAEASPDNIVRYDLEGRICYVNPQFEHTLGMRSEHLLGQRPHEVWPDGRFDAIERAAQQVTHSGTAADLTILTPNATPYPSVHRIRIAPERDASGSIIGTVAYGSDVTAIRETEQRLRHFVDNLPGVAFTHRTPARGEGGFSHLSPRVEDYFGIRPQSGLDDAQQVFGALHADDRELLASTLQATKPLHTTLSLEVRTAPTTPLARWLDVRVVAEPLPDGSVAWHGLMLDVSERKRMATEVAASRDLLHRVIDGIADPVFVKDPQHRWHMVNQAFVDFVGIPRKSLLGQTDDAYFPSRQVHVFWDTDAQVFATGQNNVNEEQVTTRHGHTRTVQTKKSLIQTACGEPLLVGVIRDITDLQTYRQRVHDLAYNDTLTNLSNRTLFLERAQQVFDEATLHDQQVGLIMLDVDHFKRFNDSLGHPVGDDLLRKVAARLTRSIPHHDAVARLGGDEFGILLTQRHNDLDLGAVARKILEAVNRPMTLNGQEVVVTCSIGVSVYPNDSTDLSDLMKFADAAMYQAKRQGRNTFSFHSQDLHKDSMERLWLEGDLRKALVRQQLELHYQPKVRLSDGVICGSEALLRWRHPTKGMIPPNRFIAIAEELGLIVPMGEWVLRTACETARDWNRRGPGPHTIAVNLSVRQFKEDHLPELIARTLAETGCQPDWIELEITESLLLDGAPDVQHTLQTLRDMGFSIAIDDFGTGYSALSYLERFPIDVLKIDQSFIRNTANAGTRAELVKAIISLAHALSLKVVAEGVEEQVQHEFLRTHHCQMAQGYAYGKPVPKPEFELLHWASVSNPNGRQPAAQAVDESP
ncbi:MAG TPA: EAL domain-containing protein [Burkholderiaceae bacterium]|nr:EAL domain-containing protein [Burkholderiaceae bacterium]